MTDLGLMRYCLRKNDESEEYNDGSGIVYISYVAFLLLISV